MTNLKDILNNGCIVETANGERFIYIEQLQQFISQDSSFLLSSLDENYQCGSLWMDSHPELDYSISKVYKSGITLKYDGKDLDSYLLYDRSKPEGKSHSSDYNITTTLKELKESTPGLEVKSVGIVYSNLDVHSVTILAKDMYSHSEVIGTGLHRLAKEAILLACGATITKLDTIRAKDS